MNNTIKYNGVQITLTPEQLAHIECETKNNRYKHYSDIKSFENACEKLGMSPSSIPEYPYEKLKVIVIALNDGWIPNWGDSSEGKYFNYFRMQGGLSYCSTYCYSTHTDVPSALCFKSREIAEYAAKQFIELYKDYYTN